MSWSDVDPILDQAVCTPGWWASLTPDQRAKRLAPLAGRLRGAASSLVELIVREVGKLIRQARAEIEKAASAVDWFIANAPGLLEAEPVATSASRSEVRYQALGPVLAIMPWNYPIWQVVRAAVRSCLAATQLSSSTPRT